MEFKYRLRNLRIEKNLTGEQLANAIGVKKTTISTWENGKAFPEIGTLIKLANYFDVSIDYILGRNNATSNDKTILDNLSESNLKKLKVILNLLKRKNKRHALLI